MKITRGIQNIKFADATIATLGSYDGIHLGHRNILQTLVRKRDTEGYSRAVVLTFDPHPQEVLRKNNTSVQLLTTIDERLALLERTGIDETVIIEFSHEFSQMPYSEFFRDILVERLGMKAMVVGDNHAFGKDREGDLKRLAELGVKYHIAITEVAPYVLDGIHVSSTKIRHALLDGNINLANAYLGREYELSGPVIHGDRLGTVLGFPTANIDIASNKLIPKDGVYTAIAYFQGKPYRTAVSIGTRPSVTDSTERVVEALLLDFEGDIYDKMLGLHLINYLREQVKFGSLDELQRQMELDVAVIRESSTAPR